jgi:hypothetical protein
MNIRKLLDIITEASIFSRGTYTYGHKVKVAAENKKGQQLISLIQDAVPDFNPQEELEWVEAPDGQSTEIVFGRSGGERYFKRTNGEYLTIVGSDSTIEGALNHAGRYNRGDIAEGILGAALSAKLTKRGSSKIGNIMPDDVRAVLANALDSNDTLIYTVEDRNSQIADKISFTLRLPSGSMDIIRNQKMWPRFADLFDSAVHYCNSADAERYSNFFYQNGKVDEVVIQSDGVSDQKGRKTDVQAVVNTTDPVTGKVLSRTLKNVDISLKADSKKYGQATAGGLKQSKEVWLANAKNVFEPFGVKIDMPQASTDMLSFWINIYQQAAEKLDAALAGANANKETAYVEMIANVIQQHGTAGNPNLKLVNFEKGQSTIHSFNQVKKRLIDSNINLGAKFAIGARSGKPTLYIYDKTSNSVLTAIRFYLTEKASTNYFEKGELLDVLTRVEKARPAVQQPVQQQVQQPAAASPEVQPELAESRILISPPRQRR